MSKSSKNVTTEKTIEEKYQKKNLHEHILDLPDTYIGSTKKRTCPMWIFNDNAGENDAKIILKEITYVPGFYKICDEVFVNAADHTKRCKSCNIIKINIDKDSGLISVWNNGDGIDVVEHKEHKVMVPSLIFGELLTSTNYDKTEKKTVGGKNGYGAKLANIYSTEFTIETIDEKRKLKFKQKYTDNMYNKTKPLVKPANGKKSYTQISFIADFKKFKMDGISDDVISLLKKRAYDLAMTTDAKVYYNDKLIAQNNFTKYIDLYFPEGSEHQKVIDITTHKRWKVCAVYDPTDTLEHQNISFVNSICTNRGGTHVDQITNQVVNKLKSEVEKKLKGAQVKPSMIKENLIFFIDSTIVNPDFDTQTKEFLTTKTTKFGSNFTVTDLFIKKIIKTGVVNQIIANAQAKAEAQLLKDSKGKGPIRYEKLYPAHKANVKDGWKCTLILTEGDSAKTFAMSGINEIGRDYYGIFPLRGKLLNVRDESPDKISKNEEIMAIMRIIGLEPGKDYESVKGLRYGSIMILTDADVDGSHIKGLIMNFIHHFWPSLIKQSGFIKSFATPIIKARRGKGNKAQVMQFTTIPEFEEWKENNNDAKGWTIKYYKGLGTSDRQEARECFEDLDDKLIEYYWKIKTSEKENKTNDIELPKNDKSKESSQFIDEESDIISDVYKPKFNDISEDAITLAFAKKREDDRKGWLNTYNSETYINAKERKISYFDFIHKELIAFSVYDTARSIPNIMDGFKPSQRKILYGCVKKNIYNSEIKVAQLSGYISEHTHYHHGEQSLNEAIIKMAQDFVGSNNINVLLPNGQFGSRLSGGKDYASPRYIHTQLNHLNKYIFCDDDFDILERLDEDGDKIEPKYYAPIIPMILVNGTEGIGTGYSTTIEPCNPRDIYNNIKRIISGEKTKSMIPWYRHFTGTIEKIDNNKFISRAKYDLIDNDTIHISDLPIGIWTDNYKAFLDNLLNQGQEQKILNKRIAKDETKNIPKTKRGKGNSKNSKYLAKKSKKSATAKVAKKNPISTLIKTYKEDCTDVKVSFTITFHPGKLKLIKKEILEKNLKLVTPLNLTNMHLFDETGKIRKYTSYSAILQSFAKVRLNLYQVRKDYLLGKWKIEADMLKWKVKFIEYVINGKIIVFANGRSKKQSEVIAKLEELQFPKFCSGVEKNATYSYLTNIKLFDLTEEEVNRLKKMLAEKKEEIATLENKTPSQIWEEELEEFMKHYDEWENECYKKYQESMSQNKKKINKKKNQTKKSVPLIAN